MVRVEEYASDNTLSPSIYRIYTREDRQSYLGIAHPHLKQYFKIAEEIFLARSGNTKIRAGKVRVTKKTPAFDLYDVTDIIGITVVCPSDDDVDRIKKRIEEDIKEGRFTSKKTKTLDGTLYRAQHIVVSIDEDPLGQLCCEIQIKTAIQDAFSWKTHGLAYKPNEKIKGWDIAQFSSVIAVLRAADAILEGIAKRIHQENDFNDEKRRYARHLLSEKLAGDLQRMQGSTNYEFFANAIKEFREQLYFPITSRNGQKINETKRKIDEIIKDIDHIAKLVSMHLTKTTNEAIDSADRPASTDDEIEITPGRR